jgi:NSS family neurotransmitter:Na+ symporter
MLPISGLMIALFVGYVMNKQMVEAQLDGTSSTVSTLWFFTVRYIAPVAIAAVFVMGIYDKFLS